MPGAYVAGVFVVAVVALLGVATALGDPAARSVVPLLRTVVLIVLTLMLLGVLELAGAGGSAQPGGGRANAATEVAE